MSRSKALDRGERKAQILAVLLMAEMKGDYEPKTVAWIARKMNLAVSQKLRVMCNELVLSNDLQATPYAKQGRYDGKVYRINPNNKPNRTARRINTFKNGAIQTELL